MKIIVTGGAGFIGSHTVDILIEAGHSVVVLDDLSSGRASNLNPKAKFYQLDIRDPEVERIFEIERPEVISHYAAQIDVRKSVIDPIIDADVNILGSIKLAELSLKYGVKKFIHISSGGAVYGEPEYLPCDENHPIKPICPYGASKYTFELYLYYYQQNHSLNYTVLRFPNVYGPRQDPYGEAGVVAIFTGQMLHGEPVTIFGSGEQVRDFVFVTDCARANLLALDKGSGGVYNLASEVGTSINQIFTYLKNITQYPFEAHYAPAKPGETFRIYLDASRARQALNWQQTISLEVGLRKTVEYFKAIEAG